MRMIRAEGLSAFPLGRLGENEATMVVFDITKWREAFGEGTFALLNRRSGDSTAYPCVIEQDENEVRWQVKAADLAAEGYGQCELIYTVGNTVVKSEIFKTFVETALVGGTDIPEPWEDWVQEVLAAAEHIDEVTESVEVVETLAQLTDDAAHRLVTDAEKAGWDGKYSKPAGGIPASDLADGVRLVPGGGTTDQVLTRTVGGYAWADAQSGGGDGDMSVSVYDPQKKEEDIFAYADSVSPVVYLTTTDGENPVFDGAEILFNAMGLHGITLVWDDILSVSPAGKAHYKEVLPLTQFNRKSGYISEQGAYFSTERNGYRVWVNIVISRESGSDEYVIGSITYGKEPVVVSVNGQVGEVTVVVPTELSQLGDDSTHRLVTDSEKAVWSGKQDAISDLSVIRSGAALGATALQAETDPTVPGWAKESSKPSYTASEVGLGNVANERQYSANNPPPYPVKSVNSRTGAVAVNEVPSGGSTNQVLTKTADGYGWANAQGGGSAPLVKSVTLPAAWTASGSNYMQGVVISDVTANTQINVQPDASVMAQLMGDGASGLYFENNNGTVSAVAVGARPSAAITVQVTLIEVTA